ncbi:hypothetical protein PIB30_061574 [Stylosanthes scabra]|uniref:Non-specific serine/threonine protein kinase n=1 Tax=Stylosanthes scabra TaxID=79078 RepID=A0ABU6XMA0_9FABA|nr:hypothetical protein [Stylosanthes scabra]
MFCGLFWFGGSVFYPFLPSISSYPLTPFPSFGHLYPRYSGSTLEMITGKKPTDSMFSEVLSLHKFYKMAMHKGITDIVDFRLLTVFDEGERSTQQQNMEDNILECLVSFARIGVACSLVFPNKRMGIKDVIIELHAIKQKLSC